MNEITKKILKALEIKPYEEFEVKYNDGSIAKYRFNTEKITFQYWMEDVGEWWRVNNLLNVLVNETAQIMRKPWEPKEKEKYYYVLRTGDIAEAYWIICVAEDAMWHIGNCFKTEEEAQANKERILELLNSDTPLWKQVEDSKND